MILTLYYGQTAFAFERDPGDLFQGRLLLTDEQRQLLRGLIQSEPEDWCLDQVGERLPPDQLFGLSPWSYDSSAGKVKLLRRFLDLRDGRALFSTAESYGGELFDWLRTRHPPDLH